MGARQDLKRAKKRGDLADRVAYQVTREAGGTVREVRAAPLVAPPTTGSAADIPFRNAAEAPDAVVMRRKSPDGRRWLPVTAAAFAREVADVAKGLIAAGLAPGGRVALMARTRPEWAVLDFAIWAAGGQSVPVYPTSSAGQIEWIVTDSDASLVVVETAAHAATARQVIGERPLWQIDDGALARLTALGRAVPDAELTARRAALSPGSVATLVYTSGTTGRPKGCVLTHANLHAEAANLVELLQPVFLEVARQTPSTLVFLPLAHILGRTIQLACLSARIEIGHCPSVRPEELRPELASFRPTFLVGVPYLFEKIHDLGRAQAERMGRGASFDRADRIAVAWAQAALRAYLGEGRGPGPGLRLARVLYDLLVYRRVRAALGGRIRYAISGGSPLDRRLNLFFFGCGILVYEGYGLTETTSAATLIPPLAPRPGTVGRPIPGTAVRIAGDGEVLVGGGTVFGAYWNDAAATREALGEGAWFATGDLGRLDEDGYLTITGRKKDILVTSGGKNVSPSVLEDRLRSRPPVGQCMVVGDGRPFVAALITLEPEALAHWLTVRKRPLDTPRQELCRDPELRADVQRAVDYANEAVSRAEAIRKFVLVPGEFTEENGLLTPSLKVKRQAVAAAYAEAVEELYAR
ncbi:AMP-dependent synthetase/ligase [Streptomyces hoynatensis]|uniref:Long-chain fatty acid--CoA ligase n=1 Tax=Streptomyces hoynatensis TaxID=1141874 RepID=A0A3A9Z652_9ACTN|nr:AMP-dependent synthetase/ligase [Streptomyces hoynatensis]RKN43763.1 long-chain fatty acid--CoA ligase [Streptomyces hoynatensis]